MTTTLKARQHDHDTDGDAAGESRGGAALVSARRKRRRARRLVRQAKQSARPPVSELRRLFVYGTSRDGERSHHHLRRSSFLREASTRPTFQLFLVGSGPALARGGAQSIRGELYEVDVHTLADLDRYERPLQRMSIVLDDGSQADTYALPLEMTVAYRRTLLNDWRVRADRPQKGEGGADED